MSQGRKWSISMESPIDSTVAVWTATDIGAIADFWYGPFREYVTRPAATLNFHSFTSAPIMSRISSSDVPDTTNSQNVTV